jgi:hypothetical protein
VGHPRFIFTLARRPPSARAADDYPGALVWWRLLSGNNRQLGRSAELFDGVAEARRAAATVRDAATSVERYVVRQLAPVRWGWSLMLDGIVVAVSGRGYEGERTAAHALELFLAAAAEAPLDPRQDLVPPQSSTDRRTADHVHGRLG